MRISKLFCAFFFCLFVLTFSSDMPTNSLLDENSFNNELKCVSTSVDLGTSKSVLLGGDAIGFEYNTKGVLVVGKNKIYNGDLFFDNIINNEVQAGDIITEVNGVFVNSALEISSILNADENIGNDAEITAVRKGKKYDVKLKPAYDVLTKKYKLGLWVKNSVSGIGTLTYIDQKNLRFGALGHPVMDANSNSALEVLNGMLYDCAVLGIKQAKRGMAGEIRGVLKMNAVMGSVEYNEDAGIYGSISNEKLLEGRKEIEVGGKNSVVPGEALIFCSIDGRSIRAYDIEIIKICHNSSSKKDLVLKVVDKRLLDATGGIVQGMSGSPIVQNGKLIGAVTHVFVNDASKGFGIFIDNMLKN